MGICKIEKDIFKSRLFWSDFVFTSDNLASLTEKKLPICSRKPRALVRHTAPSPHRLTRLQRERRSHSSLVDRRLGWSRRVNTETSAVRGSVRPSAAARTQRSVIGSRWEPEQVHDRERERKGEREGCLNNRQPRACVCARSKPPASQLTQDQCPTISVLGLRGSEV